MTTQTDENSEELLNSLGHWRHYGSPKNGDKTFGATK